MKRFLSILLVGVLLFSFSVPVAAADYTLFLVLIIFPLDFLVIN